MIQAEDSNTYTVESVDGNEKYKKLGEKAITVIELADTMTEVLDQAI